MPISWGEIRQRAIHFSREWSGTVREAAEAKSFWDEFFNVFGVRRRTVATFEEPVRNLKGQFGYIDLFWRGKLLVEHKSFGKSLDKAESQAFQYIQDLAAGGRHDEIPRYVIVSDFARIALHDLEPEEQVNLPLFVGRRIASVEFPLAELHRHIRDFAFIAGYQQHRLDPEDPANIRAAETMGRLHDALAAGGYAGHALERLLVRVLFCLFAEDTGIFEPNAFTGHVEMQTREDGSDFGLHLGLIFQVLDTPEDRRQANLDEGLARFPYVNGGLFAEALPLAAFNREMRDALVACTRFDWSRISPAVFGSLFQAVMDDQARRQIGAHYTSERDILKVIRPLFLDELRAEFARSRNSRPKLDEFHRRLGSLRFLDPACGCGNFLVIAYRELRLLEMDVLEALDTLRPDQTAREHFLDISGLVRVDVDQFYGIEIAEFPARIAETALWLMDHQMNTRLSERAGRSFQRLPLTKSATIVVGNALRLDWKTVLPPEQCSYVLGNPPFVGKKARTAEQIQDVDVVFGSLRAVGSLDYVACWYRKAAEYIRETRIVVGFVSTNSITQGEQVGILWPHLFSAWSVRLHFAHRTFPWQSEARGKAHVHVVIIGFGAFDAPVKRLYDYDGEAPTVSEVRNISPYLVEGSDRALANRASPLCSVPEMQFGNMPNDDGHLLLTDADKDRLLAACPAATALVRPFLSAKELLHGIRRWCVWLAGVDPDVFRRLPEIMARVEAVRAYRLRSQRQATARLASIPSQFGEIRQPDTRFILIPRHSSELRAYIPMVYCTPDGIVGDSCLFLPFATLYHFGVLTSAMHMAWVRQVCGRLESRYRYSNSLVYNNFPWPEAAEEKQKGAVEVAAQAVLDARARYPGSSLADLYDPLTMPPDLVRAHQALDRAVDRCYRTQPFTSDRRRVEFLFALYERLAAPLVPATSPARRRRRLREENP
jgi:hypothetical protein